MLDRKLNTLFLLTICVFSSNAVAHANVKPKDVTDNYSGRQYKENSSAYIDLVLSHGCDGEATVHAAVLIPNSNDLSGLTSSGTGGSHAGNALMGVKARTNGNWKKIRYKKGQVPTFYNHGEKQEDARAIHWKHGYVPDNMFETLTFRANTPRLEGCVAKLIVNLPTVQYCTKRKVKAWIKELTSTFSEQVISAGYSPYIEVVRDLENNPLAEECSNGEAVEVYPSSDEIDRYLGVRKAWKK